ncbi:very short patch repair endonuclease [Roseibium sp. M-1]
MVDKLSPERRSKNMAAIRSKNMKPEMVVRQLVHSLGYRYRLHKKGLPGKPDLVFSPRNKVIFVHGCFWHQHDDPNCLDGRLPKTRPEYWLPKLEKNINRDKTNLEQLTKLGWKSLVIWECETKDISALQQVITDFLEN